MKKPPLRHELNTLGPLYRITVRAETVADYVDPWRDPAVFEPEEVAEFKDDRHRHVIVEVPRPNPGYTPDDVLTANRWAAGVMARVALRTGDAVRHAAEKQQHGCLRNQASLSRCGEQFEDGVVYPGDGTYPPQLLVSVPTPDVDVWVGWFETVLGDVLASDLQPAPEEKHAGVLLADTTIATEERAR